MDSQCCKSHQWCEHPKQYDDGWSVVLGGFHMCHGWRPPRDTTLKSPLMICSCFMLCRYQWTLMWTFVTCIFQMWKIMSPKVLAIMICNIWPCDDDPVIMARLSTMSLRLRFNSILSEHTRSSLQPRQHKIQEWMKLYMMMTSIIKRKELFKETIQRSTSFQLQLDAVKLRWYPLIVFAPTGVLAIKNALVVRCFSHFS